MKFKRDDRIKCDTTEEMKVLLNHLHDLGYHIVDWNLKREYNQTQWERYFREWAYIKFDGDFDGDFGGTCYAEPHHNIYRARDILKGDLIHKRDTVGNQKLKFIWP